MLQFDFERSDGGQLDMYVALGRGKRPTFGFVRTDQSVRGALLAAAVATWERMQDHRDDLALYDPSNDYPMTGFLYFPLSDPLAEKARYIRGIVNPEEVTNPLEVLPKISLYSARLQDEDGRSLTAVKTTSSFGRLLEKGFWARLTGQELRLIEEPRFQLADDFDFLIDDQNVLIYRHTAFEAVCQLHRAIHDAVELNVRHLSQQLDFVDFSSIASGQSGSLRAARELAAIRAHDYVRDLSRDRLIDYCDRHGIQYTVHDGKIRVDTAHQLRFLQLLSRKILGIQLREEGPEYYAVSSRKALPTRTPASLPPG